jgi:hypothetical protein
MPYRVRKLPGRPLYRVTAVDTGKILSKGTTLEKAKSQIRLLYALNNPKFIPR